MFIELSGYARKEILIPSSGKAKKLSENKMMVIHYKRK